MAADQPAQKYSSLAVVQARRNPECTGLDKSQKFQDKMLGVPCSTPWSQTWEKEVGLDGPLVVVGLVDTWRAAPAPARTCPRIHCARRGCLPGPILARGQGARSEGTICRGTPNAAASLLSALATTENDAAVLCLLVLGSGSGGGSRDTANVEIHRVGHFVTFSRRKEGPSPPLQLFRLIGSQLNRSVPPPTSTTSSKPSTSQSLFSIMKI